MSDEGRSQWPSTTATAAEVDGECGRGETGSTTTAAAAAVAAEDEEEEQDSGGARGGHPGLGGGGGGGCGVGGGVGCGGGVGGGAAVDVTRCPRWRTARPVRRTRAGQTTAWG